MKEAERKLCERVQKLLALAGSPNPHEAALAAGRAAELIARHQLQGVLREAQTEEAISLFRDEPLDASKRLRGWKIALGSVLARFNDCRILLTGPVSGKRHGAREKERKIWIVGRPDDAQRLRSIYPAMVRLVEQVTMQKLQGAGHRFREDFRKGVVHALAQAMQAGRQSSWQEVEAKEGTLAPLQDDRRGEAVERWMRERLGLKSKSRAPLKVLLAAYQAGQEAGAELSMEQLSELEG